MPAEQAVVIGFRTHRDLADQTGRVAVHLRRGGLIAYPTETVYGLGCALVASALERLAALKGRDMRGGPGASKRFLLLIAGPGQVPGLDWNAAARSLAAAFWPGPLTLVLRAEPGRYPAQVVADGTVAVRESPHAAVAALVGALGAPITSTSANVPGAAPAMRPEQVLATMRAVGATREVWVLDGGALTPSPPSTVVDCSGPCPRVLRAGAIEIEALRRIEDGIDA